MPGAGRASPPHALATSGKRTVSVSRRADNSSRMWKILYFVCGCLLETQRVDWIERGRLARRIETEEHTDRRGKTERDRNGVRRHCSRPALPDGDALRERKSQHDPDAAAKQAEHDCFNEKLQQHVASARANGHAQANL